MNVRVSLAVLLAAIGCVLGPLVPRAQGQTPDALAAAYRQFFNGDKLGAITALNEILKTQPDNLPVRFASLAARNGLLRTDPATVPAFERDLDALIDLAEKRHAKARPNPCAPIHCPTWHAHTISPAAARRRSRRTSRCGISSRRRVQEAWRESGW